MNISIRKGRIEDLPRLLEIEASAIPGYGYLDGVKEEFFDNSRGELIVAETDGLPIGFARFTLEYDGSAWLEILRVHKDWQRKGCGRAIWARFMELAAQYRVPAMRMYTGEKNLTVLADTLSLELFADGGLVYANRAIIADRAKGVKANGSDCSLIVEELSL